MQTFPLYCIDKCSPLVMLRNVTPSTAVFGDHHHTYKPRSTRMVDRAKLLCRSKLCVVGCKPRQWTVIRANSYTFKLQSQSQPTSHSSRTMPFLNPEVKGWSSRRN